MEKSAETKKVFNPQAAGDAMMAPSVADSLQMRVRSQRFRKCAYRTFCLSNLLTISFTH